MPTTPAKARHLLKQNKAKVLQRTPFAIQLKYATGEEKQLITLGIDAGYSFIGFSVVTEKQEVNYPYLNPSGFEERASDDDWKATVH